MSQLILIEAAARVTATHEPSHPMAIAALRRPANNSGFSNGKLKSLLYKWDNCASDRLNSITIAISMMMANTPPNKP